MADTSMATELKVAHRFADARIVQSSAPRVPAMVVQRRAGLSDVIMHGMRSNPYTPSVQREEADSALPSDREGKTLPEDVRVKMEGAFGTDFSAVRIHEGPWSEALGALAYTQGRDIHFAPGQYQPGSSGGQALLGHELTHVVQQAQGRVKATTQVKRVGVNDDAQLEREADEMGARAARGDSVRGVASMVGSSESSSQVGAGRSKLPEPSGPATGSSVQRTVDCDQLQIECFRRCWKTDPPWPIERGKRGHYLYCQSKCLAEYMACIGRDAVEKTFGAIDDAVDWLAEHPEVVVGTLVVVAGVIMAVTMGPGGALILVAA